jgi:hypothetical protein
LFGVPAGTFAEDFAIPYCYTRLGDHKLVADPRTGHEGQVRILELCRASEREMTERSADLWLTLNKMLLRLFRFDTASLCGFVSLPTLAFRCIWLKCAEKSGIFHQSLEKMKPFNEHMIREHCRGGFCYSCCDKLEAGDPLWPTDPLEQVRASSLMELDIVSSYGYAASKMTAPKGFCKGFMTGAQNNQGRTSSGAPALVSVDRRNRHRSFEFLSVYYTLWLAKKKWKLDVTAVFSNFHALGIYYVGPYPLDLVIADRKGRLLLFNFDGQFCHGCPGNCDPLEKYASGKTCDQVEEQTRRRDSAIRQWIASICTKAASMDSQQAAADIPNITYTVHSDCHDPDYNLEKLLSHFEKIKPLKKMMQPYEDMQDFTRLLLSGVGKPEILLKQCPPSLTYIVTTRCSSTTPTAPPQGAPTGPFFVRPYLESEGQCSKLYSRQTGTLHPRESVVLTKDYFDYLCASRKSAAATESAGEAAEDSMPAAGTFSVDLIESGLLYPRWKEFNQVFKKLIRRRNSDKLGGAEKRVIKNVINYACGYFGLNQSMEKIRPPKMRLGQQIRSDFNVGKTMIFSTESFCKEVFIIFQSNRKPLFNPRSSVPLPLYLCVIELGKLRLLQIFDWLESSLGLPGSFRHLYTNVDNLILALGGGVDNKPAPQLLDLSSGPFGAVGKGTKPKPGGLKLEWNLGPETGWKFVSCALQNWAVITSSGDGQGNSGCGGGGGQENRTKTNLFPGVCAQQSYNYACQLLNKEPVKLEQQRRVNKMLGTEEHTVCFNIKPK